MSDVLIKNMEMPKNYPYRLTLYPNGHVVEHTGYSVHGHYQAIELPIHGRLIDADELGYRTITDHNLEGHNVVDLEDIVNAPTVLEASNGF